MKLFLWQVKSWCQWDTVLKGTQIVIEDFSLIILILSSLLKKNNLLLLLHPPSLIYRSPHAAHSWSGRKRRNKYLVFIFHLTFIILNLNCKKKTHLYFLKLLYLWTKSQGLVLSLWCWAGKASNACSHAWMRMSHPVKREKAKLHWRRSTTRPNYCSVSCPMPPKLTTVPSFSCSSWHVHRHRWLRREENCRLLQAPAVPVMEAVCAETVPVPISTTDPTSFWTASHRQTETWARCLKSPWRWQISQ